MLSKDDILQLLTESADATAIYDNAQLRVCFVNAGMLRIWGKAADVVGKTFEEALPEVKDQPFTALLKNVWETGEPYTAVSMPATLMIDGLLKTSYFDFKYLAIKDAAGNTTAILHTACDVTSRVLAWEQAQNKQRHEEQLIAKLSATNAGVQAANDDLSNTNQNLLRYNDDIQQLNLRLQESETDFKRLVQQAPVAILVFRGPELIIDMANGAMLEVLSKDAGIIGRPLLEGMPELKGEPAVNLLFDVYHTGKSSDGKDVPVKMMRNGQLETRYFNFSYRPLKDHNQIIGVMDIAVEVTEQVLARKHLEAIIAEKSILEAHLRANQQRLQHILDTMAEGVVIINNDFQPVYANPMAQRIMDMNEDTFKSRTYNDAKWQNERVDGTPLPIEDHPMYVMMRTGLAVYDQELGVRLPGRDLMYISVNAAPLIDEHQQVSGGIVTFTDVTNRRRLFQQQEDFISVASHELRTPVTSLKAALQLLDRIKDGSRPEMFPKLIEQANRSLNKLSDLINSLLNINRVTQGRFPIHKTTFAIAALIDECCQHIRTIDSHDVILEGDLTLQISADEQLIDQVIVNLVNNAVKYAPNSREINISVRQIDDKVRVAISDSGPGIEAEKARHIFERYYQAEYGGRQFSGLGLGLYICAEIIHKHGGEIGVDSELGKGSTFWFTLPLN